MWKVQGVFFLNYSKCIWDLNKVNNSHNCHGLKRVAQGRPAMEWKGCHFVNRRLAPEVVLCRVNPLSSIHTLIRVDDWSWQLLRHHSRYQPIWTIYIQLESS